MTRGDATATSSDRRIGTALSRDAKRPATPLAGPYGHPLHPVLVTIPIGAWVKGVRVVDEATQAQGFARS